MSVALAMIPYTNMAPYRQLGTPAGCHFAPLVPRASIEALLTNQVAAAAVPVGGLPQLGDTVEMVGRFGIAAKGPCMSVLLFSRIPFEAMHAPKTLRITTETASSVRLLYLLLGKTLGFDRLPRLAAAGEPADAELLIGDRALLRGMTVRAGDAFPHVTDLAEKWFDIHGLPFVFARWVVRKDAPDAVKEALTQWLEEFKADEAVLAARAVAPSARTLGVGHDLIERYFGVIRRCLDDSDLAGQRCFFKELEKFGRQPLFPPA
jgi:predicted solute-binding protein